MKDSETGILALVVIILMVVAAVAVVSVKNGIPAAPTYRYTTCPANQYVRGNASTNFLCSQVAYTQLTGTPTFTTTTIVGQGLSVTTTGNTISILNTYTENQKQIIPCFSFCSNLVGYWPLDEGTGTSAYDLSGNGNTGTLHNSPSWVCGVGAEFGCALTFDGASTYVAVPNFNLALIAGNQLTVSAWIDPFDVSAGNQYVMVKNGPFQFGLTYDRALVWIYNGVNWIGCGGTIDISTNQFTFESAVYDGSHLTLYVNGVLDYSCAASGNLAGNGPLDIGRWNNGGSSVGGNYFDGVIDDPRIYSIAFTGTQEAQLYAYGLEYHN